MNCLKTKTSSGVERILKRNKRLSQLGTHTEVSPSAEKRAVLRDIRIPYASVGHYPPSALWRSPGASTNSPFKFALSRDQHHA